MYYYYYLMEWFWAYRRCISIVCLCWLHALLVDGTLHNADVLIG